MPLQATSGAASYDAFGGGVPVVPAYIEEVFSCFLYTGTGASQTITNNIDLSTKGGMVWIKSRSAATNHNVFNTTQGANNLLHPNTTNATVNDTVSLTAFNTTGFTLGTGSQTGNQVNVSAATYASWTFRKQQKFFDIVTYTGNGANNREISHNLGSTPGFIIVKSTSNSTDWVTYHRSYTFPNWIRLNSSDTESTTYGDAWGAVPTSTTFTTGSGGFGDVNYSGRTYVAYLFAHNAGGFGLTGTDNVITCGAFTSDGSGNATVSLGYEPQWVLYKSTDTANSWALYDNMRGMPVGTTDRRLLVNTAGAEVGVSLNTIDPTATGFNIFNESTSANFIYIAIRRGPMKVPTSGTSVYKGYTYTATNVNDRVLTSASVSNADLVWQYNRTDGGVGAVDRLRGFTTELGLYDTGDDGAGAGYGIKSIVNTTVNLNLLGGAYTSWNAGTNSYAMQTFSRYPSFMDIVCYTGTGSNRTVSHNLTVVPELIICKCRSTSGAWEIYSSVLANTEYLVLNTTAAKATGATRWNSTTPTSSVFSLGTSANVNTSAATYVAYLFATCAGVSKVGSYTGTATTKQIDCGFTSSARFVLIKRTDSTGDWYVWDTARGIVSGNDPYMLLNATVAETTNTDYVDTYSAGFELSSTAPAAINASGGTYIFLAIA